MPVWPCYTVIINLLSLTLTISVLVVNILVVLVANSDIFSFNLGQSNRSLFVTEVFFMKL